MLVGRLFQLHARVMKIEQNNRIALFILTLQALLSSTVVELLLADDVARFQTLKTPQK